MRYKRQMSFIEVMNVLESDLKQFAEDFKLFVLGKESEDFYYKVRKEKGKGNARKNNKSGPVWWCLIEVPKKYAQRFFDFLTDLVLNFKVNDSVELSCMLEVRWGNSI